MQINGGDERQKTNRCGNEREMIVMNNMIKTNEMERDMEVEGRT